MIKHRSYLNSYKLFAENKDCSPFFQNPFLSDTNSKLKVSFITVAAE